MSDAEMNEIGLPVVGVECPDCGHSEQASVGPMLSLGFSADVTVTEISCAECGYGGPANPGADDE